MTVFTSHPHINPPGSKFCNECGVLLPQTISYTVTGGTTAVSLILDESGSMEICRDQTISGYNEYIQTLRNTPNVNFLFSLSKFSSDVPGMPSVRIIHNQIPLAHVPMLTRELYTPGGNTPLYDAIGQTINSLNAPYGYLVNAPGIVIPKVLVIIMTDGQENASRVFTRNQIFDLIKQKEALGNWSFVYLGANQDAYAVGATIGVPHYNTVTYHTTRSTQAFAGTATATAAYACAAAPNTTNFYDSQVRSQIESKTDEEASNTSKAKK